ncbi:hypothetical protein SteCoe_7002 [Stentor coeruleus]|uniref:Uncharacterized protein n=1 Tax=Stentor coeruleus TaxID=5963 RepID=A0A1R2CNK4_9CILI|nr:hypothetical protein SteCoe_7002 [Stentor coeruleus]
MSEKKSCCDFFKRIFKKNSPPPAEPTKVQSITTMQKPNNNQNLEINNQKKTVCTEGKSFEKPSVPSEIHDISELDSIFYDKNSVFLEKIDKTKAIENLDEAFGIINHFDDLAISNGKANSSREPFAQVIRGINFKEILAGEDSIVLSDQSEISHSSMSNN